MQPSPRPSLYSQPPSVPLRLQDCDGNPGKELDIGTGEMAQPFGSQHPLYVAPNNLYLPFQGSWRPLLASSQTWYTDTHSYNKKKIKSF